MVDITSIIEGTVKFRDGKKWKSRWCVMRKLSPVADCLHLQLYRDSKDRYKHGQTKASLSLQQFLGVESGFTLDKESNTIAIICQDVTVVLAFDTRERLIQWQVKIAYNLGEDIQYLILVSSVPTKAKIATGPARMHIHDHRFCLTTGVPPKLSGLWEIGHLRRYGVIDNRFCFEGGTNSGKGEGLYVLVTDQGDDITQTLKAAAQGKLTSKRRPVSRKITEHYSPRRSSHRGNDEDGPCPSLSGRSSNWDVDSNFGCGDTVSVSETLDGINDSDVVYPNQTVASIERCMSCFSKLGAPSMSRSSTGIGSQYGFGQQQVWAINSTAGATNGFFATNNCGHKSNQNNAAAVDRMSLCSSQGSSSNNSEYSIAKPSGVGLDLWIAKDSIKTCTCPNGGTLALQKNGLVCTVCDGNAPVKPKTQKPPMPLPITTQLQPTQNNKMEAYENYDFPKVQPKMHLAENILDNYDTPRKIQEYVLEGELHQQIPQAADYSNYDMPIAIGGQMCSCLHTAGQENEANFSGGFGGRRNCACSRVMSWADNLICRRGNTVENTGIVMGKLKLTGEAKMPLQTQPSIVDAKQSELYATVDVTKKIKSRLVDTTNLTKCECVEKESRPVSQMSNYINIDLSQNVLHSTSDSNTSSNYANLTYAHSVDNYNKAEEVSGRASQLITWKDTQFANECDLRICKTCGHTRICKSEESTLLIEENQGQGTIYHNYLVMGPKSGTVDVPGYLPMSPVSISDPKANQNVLVSNDKSNSNPNIKMAQQQGSSVFCYDSSTLKNPNVLSNKVYASATSSTNLSIRTRSASADSSRFLEDTEQFGSSETLCKVSSNSIHESRRVSSPCIQPDTDANGTTLETEDEVSVSLTQSNPVNIRRSESVPCKSQNRDSSSSNDSGVSTGSFRIRAKDFEALDLSRTLTNGLRKHRYSLPCTHVTLPRRSKSSDPLKELSFRFRKNTKHEKMSSAEAELPPNSKGFGSPADGQPLNSTVPYIDSRSTSSGTSDMSDYIETLSLSSHSSSDVPDATRLNRPSTSKLRPRSGKEYQNFDRSLLGLSGMNQLGTFDDVMEITVQTQNLRAEIRNYANITPVPETAESPGPGYPSTASPPYSKLQ